MRREDVRNQLYYDYKTEKVRKIVQRVAEENEALLWMGTDRHTNECIS